MGILESETGDVRGRVVDVRASATGRSVRRGRRGELEPGERVVARVDRAARNATQANHTATHLLHAALRETLGTARAPGRLLRRPRQAALRLQPRRADLARGPARRSRTASTAGSCDNDNVRAITTTLDEARALGAMALFGEKYGDVVRMVQIGDGDYSRELCGGTHVRCTAEIGVFKLVNESSSAANVRRIEAITGPVAIAELRGADAKAHARRRRAEDRASTELPEAVTSCATASSRPRRPRRPTAPARSTPTRSPRRRRRSRAPTSSRRSSRASRAPRTCPTSPTASRASSPTQSATVLGTSSTAACTSSRASRRRSSPAASRPARSSRPPPRSRVAGAAGATRWRRPAARTPRRCPTRSPPPAR